MNQSWTIFFPRLLSGSIFWSLAVIMFILFIFLRGECRYLYLSLLGVCMGVWVFSHIPDKLPITILPAFFASDLARYVPAYFAPILLLLFFIKSTFGRDYKKVLVFLCGVHFIFFVVAWLSNIIVDEGWLKVNAAFNMLIFLSGSIMLFISIRMTIRGNKQAKIFLISLFILAILIGCDILSFSCKQWLYQYKVWFLLPPFKKTPVTHYGVLCVYLSQIVILGQHQIKLLQKIKLAEKNQAKLDGITQVTQMLAHDVRKSFSMLNGMLSILESINNISELRKTVKQYTPDVKRALASVNAMINDVMEVGRNTQPKQEPVSPESLIESSLVEACHMFRPAIVNIKYDLNHNYMVNVDSLRLQRVFSNIITNAIEAMDDHCGSMWISTKEDINSQFTTFCIGNNKSFIPKKEISKLFDAFYTKNKQGGTGLGLAIAHKVISAHGGKIWCESSEIKQTVAFFFTLPVAMGNLNKKTLILPINTKAIVEKFGKSTIGREDESLDDRHDSVIQSCEKAIIEKANDLAKSIKLGIVDDEPLYRNALNELIIRSKNIEKFIEIHQFPDSDSVLKACEAGLLDILICDVDLGKKSLNGFEIVKIIRKRGDDIPICIHSNRCSPDHYEQAVKLGAQAFISKPMNRAQILKFITNSIQNKKFNQKMIKKKPTIVIIDDEMIYLQLWQYILKQNETQLYTYSSLGSFYKALDEDQSFVTRIDCIIVDRYFPEGDCIELGFTDICRVNYKYKGLLFLSSNAYASKLAPEAGFDSLIPKKPESWETLKTFFIKKVQNPDTL